MANVLDDEKRQQILALGRLGWSLRRIEQETGVRRETVSRYLKSAGVEVRVAGRWGHPPPKAAIQVITDPADSKAAIEVITDSVAWPPPPTRSPRASACEPYRELVEIGALRGRDAMSIWQHRIVDQDQVSAAASERSADCPRT